MNTQEHLERIKAKCAELLAIAEKRTAGKWLAGSDNVWAKEPYDERVCGECYGWDPDYIASCAGPAEAGWRATIAAIDSVIADDPRYQDMFNLANEDMIKGIIDAWPEDLLLSPACLDREVR